MTLPQQIDPVADQAGHWVVRLASGDIGAAELDAFKVWLADAPEHRAAFHRERALWQSLEGSKAAFASALPVPHRRVRKWARTVTPRRSLAAAAAAVIVALLAPDVAVTLRADALAGTGEVRTITLPDGSTAMLDSGAAIAIRFGSAERRIDLLRGQAWFEVRHLDPRPFRVAALSGVTQDVGTAFEVSRGSDAVTIGVTQGVVRVTTPEGRNGVRLSVQQRARYAEGGMVHRLAPGMANSIAAWRRGLIVIDERPLSDAIAEVARYRAGPTLTFADTSGGAKISGVFRIAAPDEALEALAQMGGLRITSLPGGIVILRR